MTSRTFTRILVCCLLFTFSNPTHGELFDSYSSRDGDDDAFDRGGTASRCWRAAATQEHSSNLHRVLGMTMLDKCPPGMDVQVLVHSDQKHLRKPPKGFVVHSDESLNVTVNGMWRLPYDANTQQASVVLQLCPVGFGALCLPLVPPYQEKRHRAVPKSFDQRLVSMVDFERVSVRSDKFAQDLSLRKADPGTYSIVATLLVSNGTEILAATNIPTGTDDQLVTFDEKPRKEPLAVKEKSRNVVISLSSIGGALVLFLLVHTIINRNAQVFELTQGKFLIAMLLSGLLVTSSLVLFEPRNEAYCQLWQPLIILPLHIMYAILLGRMWRIRAVISPLLLLTLEKKEHWTTKWVNGVNRLTSFGNRNESKKKKIRRSITDQQLARVIMLLISPQLVVQILILTVQPNDRYISENEEIEHERIESCRYSFSSKNNGLQLTTLILITILFMMLLVLARGSKDLPSLFNETQNILDISWVTLAIVGAGSILVLATRTEDTIPDIRYLVFAFTIGVTTVYTCFKITWPKLRLAWSGGTVMVTKLIADHNSRRKQARNTPYSFMSSVVEGTTTKSFMSKARNSLITMASTPKPANASSRNSTSLSTGSSQKSIGKKPMSIPSAVKETASILEKEDMEGLEAEYAEEEDEGEEAGSTDSSVMLIETEGQDAFPDELPESLIDAQSSLNFHSQHSSGAWQQMQSTVFKQLGSSRRDMGNNEPIPPTPPGATELAPSSSQGSTPSRFMTTPSLVMTTPRLISTVSGGQRKKKGLISSRAIFKNTRPASGMLNGSNSDAPPGPPPSGLRRGRDSLARNTGVQKSKASRSSQVFGGQFSIAGGGGNRGRTSLLGFARGGRGQHSGGRGRLSIFVGGAPQQHEAQQTIEYNPRCSNEKIRISETEAPGRRLLLRMIDVQRMLSKVNQALLTGLSVDRENWAEIRESCVALGDAFTDEVVFAWEENLMAHEQSIREEGDEEEANPLPFSKKLSWDPNLRSTSLRHRQNEEEKDSLKPASMRRSEEEGPVQFVTINSQEPGTTPASIESFIEEGDEEEHLAEEVTKFSLPGSGVQSPVEFVTIDSLEPGSIPNYLDRSVERSSSARIEPLPPTRGQSEVSFEDTIESVENDPESIVQTIKMTESPPSRGRSAETVDTLSSELRSTTSFIKRPENPSLSSRSSLPVPRRGIRNLPPISTKSPPISPKSPTGAGTSDTPPLSPRPHL